MVETGSLNFTRRPVVWGVGLVWLVGGAAQILWFDFIALDILWFLSSYGKNALI